MLPSTVKTVPLVDVRDGGALRHAVEGAARARALRDDCLSVFPRVATPFVPALDAIARRWLMRSRSPYVEEIASIAAMLGFPGVWFLNASYQWGCTALARDDDGLPWLVRTLDWPFPGLGRHVEVAHCAGPAGEFFSATWPGYCGVLSAMAPARFAASINQAPLWRRSKRPWLRLLDIAANALNTWRINHVPPDQLLRHVFETCADFAAARRMLETTPIARPVIFTLVGCVAGERCVIERTEETFQTRSDFTVAANDWGQAREPWEGRVGGFGLLSRSYEDAADSSRLRAQTLSDYGKSFARDAFEWITPPVLNPFTRIGFEACPAKGILRVVGYECEAGDELPKPATSIREIGVAKIAA
jgi:hypothetical protein